MAVWAVGFSLIGTILYNKYLYYLLKIIDPMIKFHRNNHKKMELSLLIYMVLNMQKSHYNKSSII